MELTKKILNVSIAISLVLLSLSVFIYSVRDNKAIAAPEVAKDGYVVVGIRHTGSTINVVGYNPKLNDIKILAGGSRRWEE